MCLLPCGYANALVDHVPLIFVFVIIPSMVMSTDNFYGFLHLRHFSILAMIKIIQREAILSNNSQHVVHVFLEKYAK